MNTMNNVKYFSEREKWFPEVLSGKIDLGVITIHMTNGEDVIGRVFFVECMNSYIVENPVSPQLINDPADNRVKITLLPLRPWLQEVENIIVSESSVSYKSVLPEQMEKTYQQMMSEILIPTVEDMSALNQPNTNERLSRIKLV